MAARRIRASELGGGDFPLAPPGHSGHQGAPQSRPRHRPLTCACLHLAPPPEEGSGDRGDIGGSPASAGESLGGSEDRGRWSFGQDRVGASRRRGVGVVRSDGWVGQAGGGARARR